MNVSSGVSNNLQVQANLPKIEIPKFYGKPIEWQSFWDQLSAAVDSKTNIPNVVKITYLKNALNKDVLETISKLTLTNENCYIALKVLKEWYADKKVLAGLYMESFVKLQLQPIKSMQNALIDFASFLMEVLQARILPRTYISMNFNFFHDFLSIFSN